MQISWALPTASLTSYTRKATQISTSAIPPYFQCMTRSAIMGSWDCSVRITDATITATVSMDTATCTASARRRPGPPISLTWRNRSTMPFKALTIIAQNLVLTCCQISLLRVQIKQHSPRQGRNLRPQKTWRRSTLMTHHSKTLPNSTLSWCGLEWSQLYWSWLSWSNVAER